MSKGPCMCGDPYCPFCGTLLGSQAELDGCLPDESLADEEYNRYDDDPNPYDGNYSEE